MVELVIRFYFPIHKVTKSTKSLLNQYEAIGFLITGKSIIRFAQKDENLKSEYVLVGTMMSYAIAIITGVIINNLLNL